MILLWRGIENGKFNYEVWLFRDLFGEEAFGKLKLLQVQIGECDGEFRHNSYAEFLL